MVSEEQKEREDYKGKEKRESQKRPNGRQRGGGGSLIETDRRIEEREYLFIEIP